MPYKKQNFIDGETILSAHHLEYIEDGIIKALSEIPIFYINMSDDLATVDKTDEEIEAAYKAGRPICLMVMDGDTIQVQAPLLYKHQTTNGTIWCFEAPSSVTTGENSIRYYSVVVGGGVVLAFSDICVPVGLDKVDNTADADKPVSTAQAAAILDAKTKDVSGKELQRVYCSMIPYGNNITTNGVDLNTTDFLKVGNYFCSKNEIAKTFVNCPTKSGFMMQVYSPLSTAIDNETNENWVYRLRKLQVYTGDEYIQYCYSGSTAGEWTYGDWKKTIRSDNTATTSASGLMSAADKTKLNGIATGANKTVVDDSLNSSSTNPVQNSVITAALDNKASSSHAHNYYGVCSTDSDDANKTVSIDDFELVEGAFVIVKFTNANGASNPTLDVSGTGAKPIYRYGTTAASTTTTTTGWTAGAIQMFTYDGTGWIRDYWSNTTYTNAALGQGYGTCSTAAATVAKTVSLSSYSLTTGGVVSVKFTNSVPANATLNVNSKGAKAIYYKGAKITAGIIGAGDTATFVYNGSYYHLVAIDNTATSSASVKRYGAKGDGTTDDTAAFKNALSENRVVHVPGGTYVLSDTLTVRENCCLELSQDAVLQFTQTSGKAVTLLRSASIKGNHATIFVPYTFNGKVINCDTADDEAVLDQNDLTNSNTVAVPPFKKWDPQWKMSRYVTNINICKPNSSGFHYSNDGLCYGTAVYMSCSEGIADFMWGVSMSGVRIAGGFVNGIHMKCEGDTWNHDMRVEALIDACEIGVLVENTNYAHLDITVQPRKASDGTVYAKHGFKLVDSKGLDLSSARVWDWNTGNSLYTPNGEYQHIAMVGECRGLILNAFQYYETSDDVRDLIYTNKSSNLKKLVILQEPIDRWFKIKDGEPYYYDGVDEKKLIRQADLDYYFNADVTKQFTDVLPAAIDTDGSVYNGVGYKSGYLTATGAYVDPGYNYCVATGFIPCKKGSNIYAAGMCFDLTGGDARIVLYDSSFNKLSHVNDDSLLANDPANESYFVKYEETENGFVCRIESVVGNDDVAYARFSIPYSNWGAYPMISIDKPIEYTVEGYLSDSVKVKAENVVGGRPGGGIAYVVGDSTTAGTWTGTCEDITEYYDGLTIAYLINIAGASGGTTLDINGLGAKAVRRNASEVTTHYGVNTLIHLTYVTIDGVGYWQMADYDSNNKTTSSNKTGSKMYLVAGTSQSSSGITTYSNKNVYIGTDNCLYSNGAKVATGADVDTKLESITITDDQVEFVLPADGEYVQVPTFNDVKSPYQENIWYNSNNGTMTNITNGSHIWIEPRAFSKGDVVRIKGVNFTSNYPGKALIQYFKKSDGSYHSSFNMSSLISTSTYGSASTCASYSWDGDTSTLTFAFDGSSAANFCSNYTFSFGGELATGFTINDVIMTVNEEIAYLEKWQGEPKRLDDELYAQNVLLTSPSGKTFKLTVSDSGALSVEEL